MIWQFWGFNILLSFFSGQDEAKYFFLGKMKQKIGKECVLYCRLRSADWFH